MRHRITTDEYADFVKDTCRNKGPQLAGPDTALYGLVLELQGEAGEVSEILQKASRKRQGRLTDLDREDLRDELGDVLWAVTAMANHLGIRLSDLMEENREKLLERLRDQA